jgi:RimJ/RimL family protein N-acetyltransferase
MDLNRIQVKVAPWNERSMRLVRRLGFRKKGVLRDNIVVKGELQDDVLFSLLKRENGVRTVGKHLEPVESCPT